MATKKNDKKPAQPRRGVFLGAYVPPELKAALDSEASTQHRTTSNMLTLLLSEILLKKNEGSALSLGSAATAGAGA